MIAGSSSVYCRCLVLWSLHRMVDHPWPDQAGWLVFNPRGSQELKPSTHHTPPPSPPLAIITVTVYPYFALSLLGIFCISVYVHASVSICMSVRTPYPSL
jgi:hypothetical protein